MKKRYFLFLLSLCTLLLTCVQSLLAQDTAENKITIESVVTNPDGQPISNAEVFSENSFTKTGTDGKFSLEMNPDAFLKIQIKGYRSVTFSAGEARNMTEIVLQHSDFLYDDEQKVNLGFRKVYEGDLIGAVSYMSSEGVNKDKTRIMGNGDIEGLIGYRMSGLLGELNVRGLGHELNVGELTSAGSFSARPMILIDGTPRDLDMLRISEIESITVLKDANAVVLYGTSAINGVILVTTKRTANTVKQSDFTVRYGISQPRALPQYLNSADFMQYYNLAYQNDYPGAADVFKESEIINYRLGNQYRYPNVDYYSSEFLKPFKSFFDFNGEFTGGNKFAKYYSNFGWHSNGDMFKTGYGKDARNNIYNMRVNVDVNPNDMISIETDGRVVVNIEDTPMANASDPLQNYWDAVRSARPHEFSSLLPISLIDREIPEFAGRKRDIDGMYLLGGDVNNTRTIIGNMYVGGLLNRNSRIFSFNNRINFDLSGLTKGLSFHTNVSFDFISTWYQTLLHSYKVYYPIWDRDTDRIISLQSYGEDTKSSTPSVSTVNLRRRFGGSATLKYDRTFDNIHHISGAMIGYINVFKRSGEYQGDKRAHLGLQLAYMYDKRYMIDFSGAMVNSTKLPEGNRGGFSPTVGWAWVMSNEDFMSDVGFLDYLKIKASAGIIKTDVPFTSFYLYDSRYNTSGSYAWNEGAGSRSAVISARGANPNLTYVDRKDLNVGLQAMFFNKSLGFETNFFLITNEGLPTTIDSKYPGFYYSFLPVENYNNVKYQGFETGLNYTRTFNDWTVFAGINTLYSTSVRTRYQEAVPYDYLKNEGKSTDAYWGFQADGLFQNEDAIRNSPTQTFGTVKPGDIKYKKQNDEDEVTNNDMVYLGHWQSPFVAGIQLNLTYKFISLMILGDARAGSIGFRTGDYYWVDGNKKYSEVVKNSWTEATGKTAAYPRLTTGTAYNNYRPSTYWMYDNNYFQISRIQLVCQMPESLSGKITFLKTGELFLYVTDPFLISKNKEILKMNTSGAPSFHSYILGVKMSF